MNQFASYLFYLATLALPLLAPVLVGFTLSLAIVGTGLRLRWFLIAIPTYVFLIFLLSLLFAFISNEYTKTMWAVASAFLASGALCPLALGFRSLIKQPADMQLSAADSHS
jgi:hypothetical protein